MKEIIVRYQDYGRNSPAIQTAENVGELIRCKDCKYWQDNNNGYPHPDCGWREDETPDEDDYCSRAERKENDEIKS